MMNRGILNPIQYINNEPVAADCFEADIETEGEEWRYSIYPPLFWFTMSAPGSSATIILPAMNVNIYVDDTSIWTVVLPYQTATASNIASVMNSRLSNIFSQIDIQDFMFDEYWIHRVRVEPVENTAGRARGIGYALLWINQQAQTLVKMALLKQPSNIAYYESENNIWNMFKFWQFAGIQFRNMVAVEPIPEDQFASANMAYYWQFGSTKAPRITITAQNWESVPNLWRAMWIQESDTRQLVIWWKIMDANLTWESGWRVNLESMVWEYWLHIYVDKDLVDNYKALNETIAPYVFSDEVIPDPPIID